MGGNGYSFAVLLQFLEDAITGFPDVRTGKNTVYQVRDAVLSAFSGSFLQCPSFLAYQRAMEEKKGKNNASSIFGVHKFPSDNQIRNLLGPISPKLLFPVFNKIFAFLKEEGVIRDLVTKDNFLLISLDGTWFFSSEQIKCGSCQTKKHRNGSITYYHSALTPVIVRPKFDHVFSLPPEYITLSDGNTKQDCENKSAKRWIETIGRRYRSENYTVVLLGDDLYDRRWTGKERCIYRYRYRNDVPLKDGEHGMRVNRMEVTITDREGNVKKHHSFVTDLPLTDENIRDMIAYGRSRTKYLFFESWQHLLKFMIFG